jgi:pimeloyl-ACP methyl ester carboxylesterase
MPGINVQDIDIWYERTGQGRPVILLHAFAVSGAMWFPQVPALSGYGYDVICVDQRGHGRSSAPSGPYTITQMANDIHHLIAQLDLERACVVGLSMGGRVAMHLSLAYPQDVAALVLVSAKSEPAREIRAELESLTRRAESGEVASVIEEWYAGHYQRLAEYAPHLNRKLKKEWRQKLGNGFIGAARAIIEMESMTTRVSGIHAPTLAIAGALDSPCLPFVAWYERSIPGCRGGIVPDAAHFVNIEQPEHFNHLLLRFLADQAG